MTVLEWVAIRQYHRVMKASTDWNMSSGDDLNLRKKNLTRKFRYQNLCKIIDSR